MANPNTICFDNQYTTSGKETIIQLDLHTVQFCECFFPPSGYSTIGCVIHGSPLKFKYTWRYFSMHAVACDKGVQSYVPPNLKLGKMFGQ